MGKKEKFNRDELMTIFDEFYIPAIRKIIKEEVAKERGRYEANINERLEAIEKQLDITVFPEHKEYGFPSLLGHNMPPNMKIVPQHIMKPHVTITNKMKALLKHLGIKEISKINYPAKTEIKVIKKGLPLRSNK